MSNLKTIVSYRDIPIAELAKSKLESEGIYCFLANKNHIGMNWLYSLALGGVKVQVKEEDAELALKILNEDFSSELSEVENEFTLLCTNELCEQCGSSNLELINYSRKAGAWSLLLSFPFIFFKKRYKCKDCGHLMKIENT